jgi:quercetin dioxygenase-like cupin family protein
MVEYIENLKRIYMEHFISLNALEVKDKLPGATAAYFETAHSTIAYTILKAGAVIPLHHHSNEAIDILLDGILEMQIGDKSSIVLPGMMSFVPPNVIHGAKAVTDCKVITLLHPKKTVAV